MPGAGLPSSQWAGARAAPKLPPRRVPSPPGRDNLLTFTGWLTVAYMVALVLGWAVLALTN